MLRVGARVGSAQAWNGGYVIWYLPLAYARHSTERQPLSTSRDCFPSGRLLLPWGGLWSPQVPLLGPQ